MRSSKVQVLVKALVLLMLFSSVLLPQASSQTCSLRLKSMIMRQMDKDSNITYNSITGASFGYYPLNGLSSESKYRSVYEVDLPSSLPVGAYITKIEFIYYSSAYNQGESFALYNIPISSYVDTWTNSQIWSVTDMGTYEGNWGASNQEITVRASLLEWIANKALDERKTKLYLGFRAYPEWGATTVNTNSFQYAKLRYTYEIVVRDTIKNVSGNGKIDVSVNNQPFYEANSGEVLVLRMGSVVQLRAKEEQFDGSYFWVWNQDPNTLANTISNWKVEKGKLSKYFSDRIYTDTAKASNLFSSFTAGIRKKFIINRTDKTEFDGNFQTNDVTRVVEENSVNIPYSPTLTKTSGTFNFVAWEDGGGSVRIPTDNTTYTAIYKIPNKSNTSTAFSNTSQRKFVRTDNGYLHLVYESMNHIWYERSTDNGSTWQIMNGGKYLDQGASQSKLPSIATMFNEIAIVWQEKCGDSYQIKLARFDEYSVLRYTRIIYHGPEPNDFGFPTESNPPLYSTNADPAVTFNASSTVLICWKKEMPQDSSNSGIWFRFGEIDLDSDGEIGDDSRWFQEGKVPGTTINSFTPTVSAATLWENFALAWEERGYQSSIKFALLNYKVDESGEDIPVGENPGFVIYSITQETVSDWSYYQRHYKPSIALINPNSGGGYLELGWVGERTYYENGVQKVQRNALYRRNTRSAYNYSWSWNGTTWSLGSGNVSAVNVNTTNSDGIIAWNEETGQSRYVRSSNLFATKTLSFRGTPISGQGIQVNNGSDFNSVYGITFKNSALPYYFTTSFPVSSLGKTGSDAPSSRIAVARLESAAFYISSRVSLDGKSVGYSSKPDSIKSYDVKTIEKALASSTFTPQSNSTVSYEIEYGTLDTLYSMKALSKGQAIQCRLELQDMDNGSTLKVLEKFSLDKLTMKGIDGSFRSISGNMDVRKFAGRSLSLKLIIEDGINARWGLMERVLGPEDEKEIKKITSEKVMDYAISQNYPNPFNPSTVISYEIPKASKVSLKIYDMLGKEVTTLVDEVKGEGRYSVEFNASSLPSGIYIYEIRANDFVKSGKMMLLK